MIKLDLSKIHKKCGNTIISIESLLCFVIVVEYSKNNIFVVQKCKTMKKILVLLTAIFFYTSCDEDPYVYMYVAKNKTSHNVTIESYNHGYSVELLNVPANSYYECSYEWSYSGCLFERYTSDSIRVVFDDEKAILYYSDSTYKKHDIYDESSYVQMGQSRNSTVYYYVLTDEDYQAAKSIK